MADLRKISIGRSPPSKRCSKRTSSKPPGRGRDRSSSQGLREAVETSAGAGRPAVDGPARLPKRTDPAQPAADSFAALQPYYRRVINATGVILHTAWPAVLPPGRAANRRRVSGYSLLQADLETGARCRRDRGSSGCWSNSPGPGGHGGQQQCRRHGDRAQHLGQRPRGHYLPRTIGRDRRLLSHPRRRRRQRARLSRWAPPTAPSRPTTAGRSRKTRPPFRVHPSNYQISGFTAETRWKTWSASPTRGPVDDRRSGRGGLVDLSRFGFDKEPLLADSLARARPGHRQHRQIDRRSAGRDHPRPGRT